ncbi:MAG: alpha/beta hydrolase [Candidatus Rariloculaceae bacterium]
MISPSNLRELLSLPILIGSSLLLTAFPAQSADPESIATARAGIRDLGKNWNGEVNIATQALYMDLQRSADRSGVKATMNVSYGPHELQGMDIFVPEAASAELFPVVVYIHGGGMVRGNKINANSEDLISSNIPTFFARHGMIGINANYRLVPEVQWPAGPDDLRSILTWIRENIEEYGGDPNTIFLMGNSAGGRHVASYLYHEASHFDDGPGVIGAMLSSASYRASDSEAQLAYYGEDVDVRASRVPLGLVDSYEGPEIPVFLWSAEFDVVGIEAPIGSMYAKLCAKYEDCPRFTQFQGHNHVSHIMSLNSADDEVGLAVMEFVDSVMAHLSTQ